MENIERLISDVKESLERDFDRLFTHMNQRFDEVYARFDAQASRLDRHGALLQTGSRWTNRMNQWSEKVDAALNVRVERLENRGT